MEHNMNDSFEHLCPLMDPWEEKHLYSELNSPSGDLFDFNYSDNFFNAWDTAGCVDDADGNMYDQFPKQMVQPSDVYNSNIPISCIHDINDSNEFWKDIVNNVDPNILEDKTPNDFCNGITDILSCTPLAETNDLYLKPPQEVVDTSFSRDIIKTENMVRQEGNLNSCCLDSNETNQEKNVSYVCFDYTSTGCEMGEEVDTNFRTNKTDTSFLTSTSPELNFLTFETGDNHFTNTEIKQTSQTHFLPTTANSHFLIDSNKEITLPQLNASVLNSSNLIGGHKLELEFYDKTENTVADTTGIKIPNNGCKLMDFTQTIPVPQINSFMSLQSCPDPAFLSANTDSNCSNQILNLKFEDKMNANFADQNSSKTHDTSCEKRKPNKVSKCKSLSSIKIDKKGSILSVPTNSLSSLMVKDLLQMSGSKTERNIKELTMEYRANFVKIMQQKQLRLKRMERLS